MIIMIIVIMIITMLINNNDNARDLQLVVLLFPGERGASLFVRACLGKGRGAKDIRT